MPNYQPVEIGDRITAVLRGKPVKIECVRLAGPKATPAAVVWRAIGTDDDGHMPYEEWQKCYAAQLALSTAKMPTGPDDPDEYQKLYNALDEIGRLTAQVGRVEQYALSVHTNLLKDVARDLRGIRKILKDTIGKDYPEKSL